MILTIGSWFNEPGVDFKISFKVHNFIRELLIDQVMTPFGLKEKDPQFLLNLITATATEIKELDVRGPEINRRSKTVSFGLWLPYDKINNSSNYLGAYLRYYFDALVVIFITFGVSEEQIRQIQTQVEDEVLNNKKYEYLE